MDISDVDISLLLVFEALSKTQNVTAAGTLLGLSQSATSYTLNRLRTVFEDPLFVRTNAGMQPTPYATELIGPVTEVLKLIRTQVIKRPPFDALNSTRCFTINMNDIAQISFLPQMLGYMRQHAPNCDLQAVDLDLPALVRGLESGDIDLAYGYYPDLTAAGLYQQRLFEHTFVCLCRSDHPRIRSRLSLERFMAESHILVKPRGKSPEIFEKALRDRGLVRRVRLTLPNFMSVPSIVAISDYIVTVPISLGQAFVKFEQVKMLDTPFAAPTYDIKQHWHARLHKDEANMWLRRSIQAVFGP